MKAANDNNYSDQYEAVNNIYFSWKKDVA
jgi:hypothetical protein